MRRRYAIVVLGLCALGLWALADTYVVRGVLDADLKVPGTTCYRPVVEIGIPSGAMRACGDWDSDGTLTFERLERLETDADHDGTRDIVSDVDGKLTVSEAALILLNGNLLGSFDLNADGSADWEWDGTSKWTLKPYAAGEEKAWIELDTSDYASYFACKSDFGYCNVMGSGLFGSMFVADSYYIDAGDWAVTDEWNTLQTDDSTCSPDPGSNTTLFTIPCTSSNRYFVMTQTKESIEGDATGNILRGNTRLDLGSDGTVDYAFDATMTDCDATTQKVVGDTTTKRWGCGTDQTGAGGGLDIEEDGTLEKSGATTLNVTTALDFDGTKNLGVNTAAIWSAICGNVYPVGFVTCWAITTDPNTSLGCGSLTALSGGKALVTLDAGDTDVDTTLETGGAKTVASSAQTFAGNASTDIVNRFETRSHWVCSKAFL